MATAPLPLTTRMSRWRRRVVGTTVAVFVGSWLAVLALGQHGHGTTAAASERTTRAATGAVYQDPYTDSEGEGDDGASAPPAQQAQPAPQVVQPQVVQPQSQAPLVTSQS